MSRRRRSFLLSPASTSGKRARLLFNESAEFELAIRVRQGGAPLGDVFAFLSGLYFRGKLTYARKFSDPDTAIHVITSDRGLVRADALVTLEDLRAMSAGSIDQQHDPYRLPLSRDAAALRRSLGGDAEIVLLGSIATEKYVAVLADVFREQLMFPREFVGRGDMSRGGLLLRAASAGRELTYVQAINAVRRGSRPGKLS